MKSTSLRSKLKQYRFDLIILILLLVISAFLRFYKIREFVVFLGDEGRDALVVKRIVFDGKLTLLGPTASVGGFYLGPIYYYFMIPFLLAANMDPVGPAIMIALMGIATVLLLYLLLRSSLNRFAAAITSLVYAVSPGIVTFSRSSWNPNPMPFFTLLLIISSYLLHRTKKLKYALLTGLWFGIIIQLHYLGLILSAFIFFSIILYKPISKWPKLVLVHLIGFVIGASPYIAFEIRHGFPNIRSVFEFVTRFGATTGPRSGNPLYLILEINRFNLEAILSKKLLIITQPLTIILLVTFVLALLIASKLKRKLNLTYLKLTISFWFIGTLGLSLYRGQLHPHYFEFFFLAPFLLLAFILSLFTKPLIKLITLLLTGIAVIVLIINQAIWTQGSNLIDQTKATANQVSAIAGSQPFNFALITAGNSDHAYRYFLELANNPPKTLEEQITSQLLAVCELELPDCQPLGNPIWEIAGFGRAEIESITTIQANLHIFKLIHHQDSLDLIGKPAQQN